MSQVLKINLILLHAGLNLIFLITDVLVQLRGKVELPVLDEALLGLCDVNPQVLGKKSVTFSPRGTSVDSLINSGFT